MTDALLLRPAEAAELLQVSRSKLYQLAQAGEIPVVRLAGSVRIPRLQLVEWIAAQARNAGAPIRRP